MDLGYYSLRSEICWRLQKYSIEHVASVCLQGGGEFQKCLANFCDALAMLETLWAPGGYCASMKTFGLTFATLRLHLGLICRVLGPTWASLGFIVETPGSIVGCLGHLNLIQSGPGRHEDSQVHFLNDVLRQFSLIVY